MTTDSQIVTTGIHNRALAIMIPTCTLDDPVSALFHEVTQATIDGYRGALTGEDELNCAAGLEEATSPVSMR
jgi:hypothetical protein